MEKHLKTIEKYLTKGLPTDRQPDKGKIYHFGYGLFELDIENDILFFGFRLCDRCNIYQLKTLIDYWLKLTGGFLSVGYYMLPDDRPTQRGFKRFDFPTTGDIFGFIS